jgi:hypothetical protein
MEIEGDIGLDLLASLSLDRGLVAILMVGSFPSEIGGISIDSTSLEGVDGFSIDKAALLISGTKLSAKRIFKINISSLQKLEGNVKIEIMVTY